MRIRKTQAVISMITSYLILIVLFVSIFSFVTLINKRTIEKMNSAYCDVLTESIGDKMQDLLNNSEEFFSGVLNFKKMESVIGITNPENYYFSSSTTELIENLRLLKNENYIGYIYFPHTDKIIFSGGIYDTSVFYDVFLSEEESSYDEWLEKHGNTDYAQNDGEYIFLSEKYSYFSGREILIVTACRKNYLLNSSELKLWENEYDIYLSRHNGSILGSLINTKTEKMPKSAGEIKKYYDNSDYGFFEKRIDYIIPCSITVVYPKTSFLQDISELEKVTSIFFVAFMLVYLLIVAISIRKGYSPISKMLDALGIEGSKTEYDDIINGIKNALSEKNLFSNEIKRTESQKKQMILSRCLARNYSGEYLEKVLLSNNISFKYKYFALCAFEIFDINELYGDKHQELKSEEKFSELLFIVENIYSELFLNFGCRCEVLDVQEKIFLIVNSDDKNLFLNRKIDSVIDMGLDFIENRFSIRPSYVVSELFDSVKAFFQNYALCLSLLEYKEVMGIDMPMHKEDIEAEKGSSNIFMDYDLEQRFCNALTLKNETAAKLIAEKFFEQLQTKKLTVDELRCVLIDAGCIICKVIPEYGKLNYEEIIKLSTNITGMKAFVIESIEKYCEGVQHSKYSKADIADDVVAYIEKNYAQAINLSVIANEFNVTAHYLSSFFKETRKMSVNDYINNVRLNEAKRLLRESRKTITEIAECTGFGNVRSFNRIYRKYEGIAPNEYRSSVVK